MEIRLLLPLLLRIWLVAQLGILSFHCDRASVIAVGTFSVSSIFVVVVLEEIYLFKLLLS